MKFTSMQQALAAGAIGAVASVTALADNNLGGSAELVLYVVNLTNSTAYSRGLGRVNGLSTFMSFTGTGINGAVTVSGSTYTGTLSSFGDTATLSAAQTASVAVAGTTTGYGSQAQISVNYSLPTVTPDPNLIKWLAANAGGDIRYSIQGGNGGGPGTNLSRRFITTSASNYDAGTNVTGSNLGMAVTDANAWTAISSVVSGDNALNPSLNNGDGTSITNSSYLTYDGPTAGVDTARYWFASNTTAPQFAVDALCSLGSSCNFYIFGSNNVYTSAGAKIFTYTMNDVQLDSAGYLRSIGHK